MIVFAPTVSGRLVVQVPAVLNGTTVPLSVSCVTPLLSLAVPLTVTVDVVTVDLSLGALIVTVGAAKFAILAAAAVEAMAAVADEPAPNFSVTKLFAGIATL